MQKSKVINCFERKGMILLDTTFLSFNSTGIATVIKDIEKNLKKNKINYLSISYFDYFKTKNFISWYYYYNFILYNEIRKLGEKDSFICPANLGGFLIFCKTKCKSIFLIHDIFEYSSQKGIKRLIQYCRFRKILGYVDRIVTISGFSRREIIKYFPKIAPKIEVVFSASISDRDMKDEIHDWEGNYSFLINSGKYILANGSGQPRKHVDFLIQNAVKIYEDFSLKTVLFGKDFFNNGYLEIKKEIYKNNAYEYVFHVGEVTSQELSFLYRQSACFIFPSTYEGLGLPPLEALNHGAKVIVSNIPIFHETMEPLDCYFDFNYESLKVCLEKNLNIDKNKYEILKEKVLSKFTDKVFEKKVLSVLCYNEIR